MQTRIPTQDDCKNLEDFLTKVNGEQYRETYQEFLECCFGDQAYKPHFLIIESPDDGAIIGSCAYVEELFTVDIFSITAVSVDEQHRKKGLGSHLIQTALQSITEQAKRPVTVILNTYPNKTGLYDRNGFMRGGQDIHGGQIMLRHLPYDEGCE